MSSSGTTDKSFDLIVIGGGSGGIAAAKEAEKHGAKVAIFDFVKPSTQGTTWKIGGTCVNVGCIPKKLMHTGAIYGEHIEDSATFGWKKLYFEKENGEKQLVEGEFKGSKKLSAFDWSTLVDNVQSHVHSLNWNYNVDFKKSQIPYFNQLASFIDQNTVEGVDAKGNKTQYTAKYILVAVGGRPNVPKDIPGAVEYGITSDDIFSLEKPPGKTLCVGASYISLETAGFLTELGFPVTVMVRSAPLRGFDRECADKIQQNLEEHGTRFLAPYAPRKIEKNPETGKLEVYYALSQTESDSNGEMIKEEFDTVFFATGRTPDTKGLGCDKIGMKMDPAGKIIVNDEEQTSVPNVFAIGDVRSGGIELTPVAVLAGKLLAKRLFGAETKKMRYECVPTTVFTPLEYGSCGMSEEAAEKKYGRDNILVYKKEFPILEYQPAFRETKGFIKMITLASEDERVIGIHFLGPNAGEVMQGFALGMKMGATKEDFDSLVGIHPTNAEMFTKLVLSDAGSGCAS